MTTRRRTVRKLRRPRPFLGLVMAAVMVGFAAAPTPLSPHALQVMWSAQAAAAHAASPEAAAAAVAVLAPRKVPTSPTSPAPGFLERSHPLGAPAPMASPASSAFKFMETNPDNSPVTYDPCRPIHYVTNGAKQPENGPQLVKDAVAAVSRATGLVFIDDGATTEPGGFTRKAFQPERYGDRWAPALIAWVAPSEQPTAAGRAISQSSRASSGDSTYKTGEVDISANPAYSDKFELAVLKHELGHLVGLAHDDDGDELMNSKAIHQVYEYQPGDLTGLAMLGQGKCETRF